MFSRLVPEGNLSLIISFRIISCVMYCCTFLRNLDIDINLPHLLDVGHLPEAGDHVQRGGELQARHLTGELAVNVPL